MKHSWVDGTEADTIAKMQEQRSAAESGKVVTGAMLAYAGCVAGVGAKTPEAYAELVINDSTVDPAMRRDMLNMSGCALTTLGLWRALGIDHPIAWAPYRIGKAVADCVTIARADGPVSWVTGPRMLEKPREEWIRPGDMLLIAQPEHVFTVVSEPIWEGYEVHFRALHGGLTDSEGKQLIDVETTSGHFDAKAHRLVLGKQNRSLVGLARVRGFKSFTRPWHLPLGWEVLINDAP